MLFRGGYLKLFLQNCSRFLSLSFAVAMMSLSANAKVCINSSSYDKMFGSSLRSDILGRSHSMALESEKFADYSTFTSTADIELPDALRKAIDQGCTVIVGIYTSRECLLAGPILKEKKVALLSPTCGTDELRKFSPFVRTGVPSIAEYSRQVADIIKKSPKSEVIVFHQPAELFSEISFREFKARFGREFTTVSLDRDGVMPDAVLNQIVNENKKGPKTFVFFTYPLVSAKVVERLDEKQGVSLTTTIVGSSSWAFDVSVFKTVLGALLKAKSVLVPDLVDWDSIMKSDFAVKYRARFGESPLGIHFISYDITRIAVRCFKKAVAGHRVFAAENFEACLVNDRHQGLSGPIVFDKESPFALRKVNFPDFRRRLAL